MGHHVLVQLLYRFLDLLIGHMLLLLPIGIGRGIALLLALSILNDCCRLIKSCLLAFTLAGLYSEAFSSVVTFVAAFLAAAVFCACTVMTLEIGSMVIMVTSV